MGYLKSLCICSGVINITMLLSCIIIVFLETPFTKALLYPRYTVLQVTGAVSWPVVLKERKVFVNTGFIINYQMPYNLSSFTKPVYLANKRSISTDLELSPDDGGDDFESHRESREIDYKKYNPAGSDGSDDQRIDFTAGEFYTSMEEISMHAGYDKTCVLKSVCQLARHPLHFGNEEDEIRNMLDKDDSEESSEEHLLAEVIHFFLTPSVHQSFGADERYLKEKYEMAENIGRNGNDCESVYSECHLSVLDHISYIK